ncbi:hypothetical protein VTN77DRAFT_4202 [Rasamsonia byssochlamydoides]|uniref:uncharacterized protein n=1 Tax=Rasamsonia byssochlamydoides TaxID=89139 RepID=UPI0037449EEA
MRIPGPRWAALTRWWLFVQEMRGNAYEVITELHRTYGPLVRIAPGELSINDDQAFAVIYGQASKFTKAHYYYRAFKL